MDLYADLPPDSSAPPGGGAATGSAANGSGASSGAAKAGDWATAKMLAARRKIPVRPTPVSRPSVSKPSFATLPSRTLAAVKREDQENDASRARPKTPPASATMQMQDSAPSGSELGFEHIVDPYDPARPNDYMEYCEMRIERRRQEEREKEYQETLKRQDEERRRLEEERMATIRRIQAEAAAGATAAPPAAAAPAAASGAPAGRGRGRGLSNLPAWLTQQPPGAAGAGGPERPEAAEEAGRFADAGGASAEGEGGAAFASRVMAGMGYKDGAGLGKEQQGISQPLQAQSVGNGMGVVGMHADDRKRAAEAAAAAGEAAAPRRKRGLFTNPTCVLLLKNMVGPGEVDENLAEETKGECERFGPVSSCAIHEVSADSGLPEEERVRTFIHFERQESAVKAFREMNGRFFGGRQIAASFYDEMKFMEGDLAPAPTPAGQP